MAITRTFIAHSQLKASDLNELVAQINAELYGGSGEIPQTDTFTLDNALTNGYEAISFPIKNGDKIRVQVTTDSSQGVAIYGKNATSDTNYVTIVPHTDPATDGYNQVLTISTSSDINYIKIQHRSGSAANTTVVFTQVLESGSGLVGDVAQLQSDVSGLQGNIEDLQETAIGFQSDIEDIDATLNGGGGGGTPQTETLSLVNALTNGYEEISFAIKNGDKIRVQVTTDSSQGVAIYGKNATSDTNYVTIVPHTDPATDGYNQVLTISTSSDINYIKIQHRSGSAANTTVVFTQVLESGSGLVGDVAQLQSDMESMQSDVATLQGDMENIGTINEGVFSLNNVLTNYYQLIPFTIKNGDKIRVQVTTESPNGVNMYLKHASGDSSYVTLGTNVGNNSDIFVTISSSTDLHYLKVQHSDGQSHTSNVRLSKSTGMYNDLAKVQSDVANLEEEISGIGDSSNVYESKIFVSNSILITGASFAASNNGWFELLCQTLGVTPYNQAVGGSSILNNAAERMMDADVSKPHGSLFYINNTDVFDDVDVLMIYHAWNYNVFISDTDRKTIAEYETIGAANLTYAQAFDYVIQKYMYWCSEIGKHCQIILCTHWHDARTLYNDSIRKVATRYALPLIEFDKKIGWRKETPDPYTNAQISLNYTYSHEIYGSTETINGVEYGWHPDNQDKNGGVLPYIQKKFAAIALGYFEKL